MVSYGDWLMMRGGGVEFKASTLTIVLARGSQQSMSAKKKKNTQGCLKLVLDLVAEVPQ